jgi:EmrB/QacA subfamily drug resistance transporter
MLASAERKWFALALLCAVQFMVVLDIAIVNVALPSIQDDLGFSQENLQWVISAYALFFGGFLLLGGRAADLLGRRRMFIAGTILFTLSSLLAGLAWSEASLIAARGFQGLGAAVITPAALSILMTTFAEGKERNTALGAWGGVGAFGAVAGVLLGGVLTDLLSWEWIFFINVPVGLTALALTPLLLEESRDLRVKSFDAPGAVLVTAGLVALVFGITQASDYGWGSGATIGIFLASAALLVGFLVWEVRAAEPLMPLWIFRIRTVAGANVAGLTLGTAVFAMFLMLTLYMQQVLTYSPMKTGVAYLAVAGTAIIWSFVASTLVTRVGVKPVLVAGMTMLTAGLVYFTQVSVDGSYAADLLPGFLLIAVGLGFSFVSISIAALAGVRHSEAGLASGLINTSQQVGGALGVAVLATVANSRTDAATADGSALPVALTNGFGAAFIVGAAIAFAGVLVGLFVVRREDLAQPEAEEELVLEPALELDEAA